MLLTLFFGVSCVAYMDDVLILSNKYDHNKDLDAVMSFLSALDLKVNPFKGEFIRDEIPSWVANLRDSHSVNNDNFKAIVEFKKS